MKRVVKPDAKVEIQTGETIDLGGDRIRLVSWNYGVAMVRGDDGAFHEHPEFKVKGQQGQYRRFLVELLSDSLPFDFQSHLSCYTGRTPFCQRAHRGHDIVGVARRRDELGGVYFCECDPDRCPLRQNHAEPDSRTAEITTKWAKVYPYGKLILHTKEKGQPVTKGAKCMPENYLLFNLLQPDGVTYAHAEGECAVLGTHSEVTHGWMQSKLEQLYARTGGHLTGLRLWLQYGEFETRFNKTASAWRLEVPEGTDFELLRAEAGRRAQLRTIDYAALPGKVLDETCTALVASHGQQNLAILAMQSEDAVRQVQAVVDQLQADASYIDPRDVYLINHEPIMQALISRIGVSYARETALPMMFGRDLRRCLDWFRRTAAEADVDISDLLPSADPQTAVVPVSAPPASQPESADDIEDADFTEQPDRTDEEIDKAVRGGSIFAPTGPVDQQCVDDAKLVLEG